MLNETAQLDTVIIGGGITGLYTCYQLRQQKGPSHKIALFEASDRFGGRIETVEMDGFLAEFGPMRFEKKGQPLLMQLIQTLGLETCYFPPYTPATNLEALFDLEKDEGRISHGHPFNALELLSLGILRILQQSGGDLNNPRDTHHWEWWATLDEPFYHQVRSELTFNGIPLHKMGFWNALSEVLSHNALKKIIEYGTFYHLIHQNPNAAEWINFWLRGLHPGDELVGIRQGTEALITELIQALVSPQYTSVQLYKNHCLSAIHQDGNDHLRLVLKTSHHESVTVRTRHLILAIPQSPLKKLLPFFPDAISRIIDAVIPIPLMKCFFVTKKPWWNAATKPQTRASSIPARELHYYYREEQDEKRGMVMVYGDAPSMNYWKFFVTNEPHQKAEINQNERLIEQYLKYLTPHPGNIHPKERIAQTQAITCFGIRDWSREPFEAGCHIWKPGIQAEQAIALLASFGLADSPAKGNIHICGEAYSDFQGFIEGGLRSALGVIPHIQ
ncbi:NAD(P)/FAD-dependent oxidoreductase [Nitrosomonas sp.]|uniref:flavin monoamine oxidase family protein n=1 Tax=Nitrosomonas sp. TaxID=42353 RepID=UPI0026086853|nr:NAD(P)/FAD-dependent oxidoreductase [Nitrosomonas sp.]MCW5601599.1 FAD-dependent oxidoreductase [Nitrosomonas sp.]